MLSRYPPSLFLESLCWLFDCIVSVNFAYPFYVKYLAINLSPIPYFRIIYATLGLSALIGWKIMSSQSKCLKLDQALPMSFLFLSFHCSQKEVDLLPIIIFEPVTSEVGSDCYATMPQPPSLALWVYVAMWTFIVHSTQCSVWPNLAKFSLLGNL